MMASWKGRKHKQSKRHCWVKKFENCLPDQKCVEMPVLLPVVVRSNNIIFGR